MSTRRIAYTGLFIALAVALGFALVAIPNFEMISATVFIAGWLLGPGMGALVGFIAELVFSGINPAGSGFLFPPLLIAQVISVSLIGFVGGVARRGQVFFLASAGGAVSLGLLGGLLTIIFDFLTTISYPLVAGFNETQIWATLGIGALFYSMHVISNAAIFAVIVPAILKAVHSQLGITGVIR
ncbi:MAG: ECF transporter S component [Candidatus Marinimicrobia bacterium]|nr:ECF transporter S component [Candidatus Neomarinimicrobiota bacterium]MCF7828579.1 ECF transporter S component [Candidatus Neomarinimicrobiota bacterium]MCF7880320.1 ECF transporter S component [Candidatus Neomarinimicrobiota bacterium]